MYNINKNNIFLIVLLLLLHKYNKTIFNIDNT